MASAACFALEQQSAIALLHLRDDKGTYMYTVH